MIIPEVLLRLIFMVLLVGFSSLTTAQVRIKQSINTSWEFFKGDVDIKKNLDVIAWENVNLPHSYNTHDVLDDEPGYYRGNTWYRKNIFIPSSWKQKDIYLFFEGVNQVATVYVNGNVVGKHIGGYTFFRFKINKFLNTTGAANEILVQVNNEFNSDIPPLTADFTFFGGIYRDVFLEAFNSTHFNVDDHSSQGIFVTTPAVSQNNASIHVRGTISSATAGNAVIISSKVYDPLNKLVAQQESKVKVDANSVVAFVHDKLEVSQPQLWSPEFPQLYKLVTTLVDAKSKTELDMFSSPVGFRWFSFTADQGFFLNGKPLKIWGTSRHQDFPFIANALPDALHVRDVQLLKDMGGNFLRVAHYPQDPAVLEACDRLGILASVEIPVVNTITESSAFTENSKTMQVEMIRQNFNHPSVIMWAYMNEVLLRLPFNDDKPRQEKYFKNVNKLAISLDSLTRMEDPSRVTMMAFHGYYDLYKRVGLVDIPMVAGWNLYQGWYSENVHGFADFLDKHIKENPNKPMLITEYGADGDPRVRGFSRIRFDKTVEYETYYHQVYIKAMEARPFVSGGLIWNLADFNSETRAETMPHVNNKGIVDSYRNPKDAYLLYQSYLSKKPYLRIGSRSWDLRSGIAISEDSLFCRQEVEIFTNSTAPVTLKNNQKIIGVKTAENGVATFQVPFSDGLNQLQASADNVLDFTEISFLLQPAKLNSAKLPFKELNVSLGDQRFFVDETLRQVWLPEKQYEPASWGYIGGTVFTLPNKSRQQYGSDKNILGTEYDPIYETQRIGIEQFKLDVPDGAYEIILHFAELLGGDKKEALVYNLGSNDTAVSENKPRSFNVQINGQTVIENLSNTNYLIPETAYNTKTSVVVRNGTGVVINFQSVTGEPILNGIQIKKVY